MIELTAAQIADITGGTLTANVDPALVIKGVDTDSRECQPGWLFVAKPGETTDGHLFIGKARANGAVLSLSERETQDDDAATDPAVIVADAVLAMGKIAAHIVDYLRERGARVVGITGSAGKTTTKDLLATVMATAGPTIAPIGSFNGEVGVPLTVFRATEDTKYLVVEMGATGLGHITYLTDMVHPEIGIELFVGSAHAGEFGGIQNIAIAKRELVEALPASGTAILNRDDANVLAMKDHTSAHIMTFGVGNPHDAPENSLTASNVEVNAAGNPSFELTFPNASVYQVTSGLMGRHHVGNILAAAAGAYALGVEPAVIAQTLTGLGAASRWRMERTDRADGITIINDAYNANPESMRAALRTLAELGVPDEHGNARRTWAVLGEMLELGDDSIQEHDMLGRIVVRMNIKKLVVIGQGAKAAFNSAVLEGSWGDEAFFVNDVDEAEALLAEKLEPGDIVLFKSSNGAGLRYLGDRIAALSTEKNVSEDPRS